MNTELKALPSEEFCRRWADAASNSYVFDVRHNELWDKPWRVEFYDLHKWGGNYVHHNGHDAGSGDGMALEEAWEDMEKNILEYEDASSREMALINAELKRFKAFPFGWGMQKLCK